MKHLTLITVLFSILLISCDPEDIIGNLGGNGNGNSEYDCPELKLNYDDPCVGFDEETGIPYNGIVNEDCDCINLEDIDWDCPEIYATSAIRV